jgi:hypothetical protein
LMQVSTGAKDIAVKRLIYPKDGFPVQCDSVKVVLQNVGYQQITAFTLKYYINQIELAVKNWTGVLQPGDSLEYTFDQAFQIPLGTITACVTATLVNDVDTTNNKLCRTLSGCYNDVEEPQPVDLVLDQNVPNPSNGHTSIRFVTPHAGTIRFFVVDLAGRPVIAKETVVQEGEHTIEIQREELTPGFYLYGIEMDGRRLVKRMVVSQ